MDSSFEPVQHEGLEIYAGFRNGVRGARKLGISRCLRLRRLGGADARPIWMRGVDLQSAASRDVGRGPIFSDFLMVGAIEPGSTMLPAGPGRQEHAGTSALPARHFPEREFLRRCAGTASTPSCPRPEPSPNGLINAVEYLGPTNSENVCPTLSGSKIALGTSKNDSDVTFTAIAVWWRLAGC